MMLDLIPVMLALVLALFMFVSLLACIKCKHALAIKMSDFLWTALHKLSRFIFKDIIKEARANDGKGPRIKSVSQGKEVPRIIILMIGAYTSALALFAAMTFWDVFLLDKTNVCDDGLDCFPRAKNRSFALRPIQNCSVYTEESTDEPVICYAFVFDIGTAAGITGGLITGANHILRGISAALLAAYNKAEEKDDAAAIVIKTTEGKKKKYWFPRLRVRTQVLIGQHFAVILLSLLFIVAVAAAIMLLQFFAKVDIHTVIYAASLLLTIVLALTIPWYKLPSAKQIQSYDELKEYPMQ